MYRILKKEVLAPSVKLIEVEAPAIAAKGRAGQFAILRVDEEGERIPLTLADWDRDRGTLTLVFQEVGVTTMKLGQLEVGDRLADLAGPMGRATEVDGLGTVACVGGGIGIAPIYPIARAIREAGNRVISIIGARNKEMLILEEEMRRVSDALYVTTDDGSYGRHGFVSDPLQDLIDSDRRPDRVIAVGPLIMMKVVADVTRPYGIETVVSLNSIMIDGTGMCGGCRVSVGGETKFTCVDGPEFDGHAVDFDLLIARNRTYAEEEKQAVGVHHQRRYEQTAQRLSE